MFVYAAPAISIAALSMIGMHVMTMRGIPLRPSPTYYSELARSRFPDAPSTAYPLSGHVAIVTGSSGGLGKQIATELFTLGCDVILAARNFDKLKLVENELNENAKKGNSASVVSMKLDSSNLDDVRQFVDNFKSQYKSLDWLVNNAGIHYGSDSPNQQYVR